MYIYKIFCACNKQQQFFSIPFFFRAKNCINNYQQKDKGRGSVRGSKNETN